MNIMYITTSLNAPNGVCASNVISALMESGHNVCVFTQDNGTKEIECACDIIRSKHQSMFVRKEKTDKHSVKKLLDHIYKIWIVLCYPIWPIYSPVFFTLFSREAWKVAKEKRIDLIVAEYGDIACLNAGRTIKKKNKNIKTIAYFIDALYCGAKPSHMSETTKKRIALHWENKMLRSFDKTIMMRATERTYREIKGEISYYNKISFLDIPMLIPVKLPKDGTKNINDEVIRFVFVGTIPRNIRNPQYVLELFSKTYQKNWHLLLYGNNDYDELVNKFRVENIENKGKVSHEEALRIISEADYLINIGNSVTEMVPSKIFEYMSTGKPIISTYKVKNDPCLKYLSLYGNALCLDEKEDISKSIEKMIEFVQKDHTDEKVNRKLEKLLCRNGELYLNTPMAFVDCVEGLDDIPGQG